MESGTKLGHYEISSLLGKGGMGEVWRARDTKLGREVAIKTLPEEFAKDADRLARFEREAKLLASLNHPNIAAIHGFEEDNGTHFLVLELVEGDTLADRLKRSAIPVEESLKLALQITEALEAAHEKGVIHRDLKPSNIKVTPNGNVKVLDFGLAKALAGDGGDASVSNSPTLSMAATQAGIILGTAAYMSPEQASGEAADHRADVWAFGVVLFEMLTGRQLFTGKTASHVMGAVLNIEPDWNSLPANLHSRVRMLLERSLEKEAKDRLSGISDARVDIQKVLADPSGVLVQPAVEVVQAQPQSKLPWVAGIAFAIAASVAVWNLKPTPGPAQRVVTRFTYELPQNMDANLGMGFFAVSPMGDQIVYGTSDGLYLRSMAEWEASLIPGTEGEDSVGPFFSPDGEWIGYWSPSDGQLKKVLATGSAPVVLADAGNPFRPSWSADDWILYAQFPGGIMRVSADAGEPEVLVAVEDFVVGPVLLPDGDSLLFTVGLGNERQVVVRSLDDGNQATLFTDATSPVEFLTSGHLVYAVGNDLRVRAFDAETWEVGSALPSVQNIFRLAPTSALNFDVSESGSLVYVPGPRDIVNTTTPVNRAVLALVNRSGQVETLNAGMNRYQAPRLSPDDQRLTVASVEDDGQSVVWVYDLFADTQILPLTQDGNNISPIWTPNGERITYASDRNGTWGIYWQNADGTGAAEPLWVEEESEVRVWPESWSPDGKTLSFARSSFADDGIWTLSIDEGGEPALFYDVTDGTDQFGSMFSPNGDWIAFHSNGIGDIGGQVWALPFPLSGVEPTQISQVGGMFPLWSADGAELFYRRPVPVLGVPVEDLTGVGITVEGALRWSAEQMLPIEGFRATGDFRNYDLTRDGQQFLVILSEDPTESDATSPALQFRVVLNWFEELKERVPVP